MNDDVKTYYNQIYLKKDKRLDYHLFELPFTMHYIRRYLPPGIKILDISCGTGKLAELLLKNGYQVGLGDFSEANITHVKNKFKNTPGVLGIEQNDVLKSGLWEQEEWDAILLLGPMHHLISKNMRIRLLRQAEEFVKPGGYIYTSFMSRVGAMVYGLKNNPEGILKNNEVERLWKSGNDEDFVEGTNEFKHAYFAFPEEIIELIHLTNLKNLKIIGFEGVFGERMEIFHSMDEKLKAKWFEFIFMHCEDDHMINLSKNLLNIARKPKNSS